MKHRIRKNIAKGQFLSGYTVYFFIAFFILALWAFWTSYYGILSEKMPFHIHFHGLAMTLWCLMLIGQALLIRFRKTNIHRMTGRISYLLVPVIIISGLHIAHVTISRRPPGSEVYYYLVALMYNSIIVFTLLYLLAISNLKRPAIHARYMVCTVFPLFTPVTDRLIYKYFDSLVPLAPKLNGMMPMVPAWGFAAADVILMALAVWDGIKNRRYNVFPVALGLLLLYQFSVLHGYKFALWKTIADGMMRIPLA